jgi:hypothetical protein
MAQPTFPHGLCQMRLIVPTWKSYPLKNQFPWSSWRLCLDHGPTGSYSESEGFVGTFWLAKSWFVGLPEKWLLVPTSAVSPVIGDYQCISWVALLHFTEITGHTMVGPSARKNPH